MCSCEGYAFQAVKPGIGYRNQRVLFLIRESLAGELISGMKN